MRDSSGSDLQHARRAFLQMLEVHSQADPEALLTQARRMGYDFSHGVLGVSAALGSGRVDLDALTEAGAPADAALLADVGDERLLGLVPVAAGDNSSVAAEALLSQLHKAGLPAISSAARRGAGGLQDALHE